MVEQYLVSSWIVLSWLVLELQVKVASFVGKISVLRDSATKPQIFAPHKNYAIRYIDSRPSLASKGGKGEGCLVEVAALP